MSLNNNQDKKSSPAAAAAAAAAPEPVCDICWHRGNKSGLSSLWTCRSCHVSVHAECYELGSYDRNNEERRSSFVCWACQAVGKTVKFRDAKTGERLTATITTRPTTCCLCGRNDDADYPHAMHPLYDDYGPRARQIKLPGRNPQPAWVHTLCALVVGSYTGGVVYACNRNGEYEGPQAEDDDERQVFDDESSINSELQGKEPKKNDDDSDSDDDDDDDDDGTHHYVYVLERWYDETQGHVKFGRELRELKCQGCGKTGQNNFMTALQCMANTKEEFQEFKKLKPHAVGTFSNSHAQPSARLHILKLVIITGRSVLQCLSRGLCSLW